MLDGSVPATPDVFQSPSTIASVPSPLPLEGARTLLRYRTYFRTETGLSRDMLKTALSLRYQVYCLERSFEKFEKYPDRLEIDEFDARSVHGVLLYKPWDQAIGTTRLILPRGKPAALPVHLLLGQSGIDPAHHFPGTKTAEVSRFAIARSFRPDGQVRTRLPCLGLIQILLRLSLLHGITHWAAVMQPALLRMLATMGIEFTPIGPLVTYHGLRQPSICDVGQMLPLLLRKNPAHWQIVTDGGCLADKMQLN